LKTCNTPCRLPRKRRACSPRRSLRLVDGVGTRATLEPESLAA
jgi:hypothetical protein